MLWCEFMTDAAAIIIEPLASLKASGGHFWINGHEVEERTFELVRGYAMRGKASDYNSESQPHEWYSAVIEGALIDSVDDMEAD